MSESIKRSLKNMDRQMKSHGYDDYVLMVNGQLTPEQKLQLETLSGKKVICNDPRPPQ